MGGEPPLSLLAPERSENSGSGAGPPKSHRTDRPGGQRYYLYDNELSRPTSSATAPTSSGIRYEEPKFIPRGCDSRPRGRLPFNRHDYVGIYPSAKEIEEEKYRKIYGTSIPRVPIGIGNIRGPSQSQVYTRPPDEYHGQRERDPRRYEEFNDRSRRYDYDRSQDHNRHQHSYDDHDQYHHRKDSQHHSRTRHPHSFKHGQGSPKYRSYWDSDIGLDKERSRSRTRTRTRSRSRSNESNQRTREKYHENDSSFIVPERNEFDLSIELHPFLHYIDDKDKLLDEAFGVLQGKRLKAMIPPALKDLSLKELEAMCREELDDLSIATIANVIDGKVIPSTEVKRKKSETQNESETVTKKKKKKKGDMVKKVKKQLKDDIAKGKSPVKKKKKAKGNTLIVKKSKVKGEGKKKKKKKKSKKEADEDSTGMAPQKTLMELLELEYRAKAIKAMLKTQGHDADLVDNALAMSDPETNVDDPSEPIATSSAIKKADSDQRPLARSPINVRPESPKPTISDNVVVAVSPDSSTKLIPSPKLESPVVVSSSANDNDEGNSSPENSTQKSESVADIEEGNEIDKSIENEEEELDYEDELVIYPNFTQDLDEPVEVEEGEIQSGAEESDSEEGSLASHRSRSSSKSPIQGNHKNDHSEGEDEEHGGWRRSVSDSDSDSGRPKRSRYKRNSPTQLSDNEKLSEVSNDDLVDKEKPGEAPEKDNSDEDDVDSLYEQNEAASPHDVESDSSIDFEDTISKDDGIIIDPIPVSNEEMQVAVPEHTCAEKPPDYVEEEEEIEEEPEPKSGNEEDEEEDDESLPRTWFNRWYNSKKVQKNVKSNKMIGRLRSKLRKEKLIPDPPKPTPEEDPDGSVVPIIGSIQEYEKLFSNPKYKYTLEEEGTNDPNSQPLEEENDMDDNSDDDDDDDNDELWKDIIGNTGED